MSGTLVQRGASECLLRGGKAKVQHTFTYGAYVYIALGKEHAERHTMTLLVHVPARINKNDSQCQGLRSMVPHNACVMSELEVPSNVSLAEQERMRTEEVLASMDKKDKLENMRMKH